MSRTARLDALTLFAPRRAERGFFVQFVAVIGVLAVLPASILFQGDPLAGDGGEIAINAAKVAAWAGLTALFVRLYVRGIRLRRLKETVEYAGGLFRSLPNRTPIECLAVLQEIQNRYAEADKYLAKVDDEVIRRGIEEIRANIELNYRARIGSTKYTKDDAAEFARTMELLGRDRGGGRAPLGR